MTIEEMITKLSNFWKDQGATIFWPYDIEKGSGTANPLTFLKSLGDKEWNVAYLESCRRPQDGRYGDNPNRVYQHHQFQLFLKPAPKDIEKRYLQSLECLGIDIKKNDIKFLEDNWEQPSLGAWGLGSEVRLNGSEITQFTYFKQVGNIDLKITPIEIAYGLERLALIVQNKEDIFSLQWSDKLTYRDIFYRKEYELSKYTFEVANKDRLSKMFSLYIEETKESLSNDLSIPAYESLLKASHVFNILDAQKSIAPKERQKYMYDMSSLSKECCKKYLEGEE